MLTSVVLILAGITAWCVAALALALVVGPLVRKGDRKQVQSLRPAASFEPRPATGAITLPLAG
ncbi:hypothetical protein [Amnibacterium endophyticum]|uniref:Uncharacterized protein n=1 Tax=Amnibacterium endophyticum TaxID=2109337 RepID=A0ABW4LKA6_9MICO